MKLIRNKNVAAVAAIALAAGLGACKPKDQVAVNDSAAARADSAAGNAAMATRTDTGALARTDTTASTAATPNATWTDAAILGFVTAANAGEVELGKLGETKATNAKVKAFARQMANEHKGMQTQGAALAKKVNAMPDTTANDAKDLMNHGRDELNELNGKAAGADWDKNYMDKMVDDHQKVLDKLKDAAKNTTNADLQKALEAATGKVQAHLTKAKDIVANTLKA